MGIISAILVKDTSRSRTNPQRFEHMLHRLTTFRVLVLFALITHLACESGDVREFNSGFRNVTPDITEKDVLAILGPADERTREFRLSQRKSFEPIYDEANQSGAQYWLLWFRGIDLTYAVGFSEHGEVVFKAVGGT